MGLVRSDRADANDLREPPIADPDDVACDDEEARIFGRDIDVLDEPRGRMPSRYGPLLKVAHPQIAVTL